jgi:Protein of unknown function (DUF3455)
MRHASKWPLPALSLFAALLPAGEALAQMPNAIAAPDEAIVVTLHAQGAQIYECKAAGGGKLSWTFREPIATLLLRSTAGNDLVQHRCAVIIGGGNAAALAAKARR